MSSKKINQNPSKAPKLAAKAVSATAGLRKPAKPSDASKAKAAERVRRRAAAPMKKASLALLDAEKARVVPPLHPAGDVAIDASESVRSASKQSQVIAALRRPGGATLVQLVTLTGWQPHTVRGTISGVLRKKLGLPVTSVPGDEGRTYRINERAA